MALPTVKKAPPPSPFVQSDMAQRIKDSLRRAEDKLGVAQRQRLERAADEGANLALYTPEALQAALNPEASHLLTVMDPGRFQDFAARIPPSALMQNPYDLAMDYRGRPGRQALPHVMETYGDIGRESGWSEVPELQISMGRKTPVLFMKNPPAMQPTSQDYPFVSGHEGRHRSMSIEKYLQEPKSLVVIRPEGVFNKKRPMRDIDFLPLSDEEKTKYFNDFIHSRESRVVPEERPNFTLLDRLLTEEKLPKLTPTFAEGGEVQHFDVGGGPVKKGVLSGIKFVKGMKEQLPLDQQKALDMIMRASDKNNFESFVHGRTQPEGPLSQVTGRPPPPPYISKVTQGDEDSVRLPDTFFANRNSIVKRGNLYTMHTHPEDWSLNPSGADIASWTNVMNPNMFTPVSGYQSMFIASHPRGGLLRLGPMSDMWTSRGIDPSKVGAGQRRTVNDKVLDDYIKSYNKVDSALVDEWAKAHGLKLPGDPFAPRGAGVKNEMSPVFDQLQGTRRLNRLGEFGANVSIDASSRFPGTEALLSDVLPSFEEYLQKQGKAAGGYVDDDSTNYYSTPETSDDTDYGYSHGGVLRMSGAGAVGEKLKKAGKTVATRVASDPAWNSAKARQALYEIAAEGKGAGPLDLSAADQRIPNIVQEAIPRVIPARNTSPRMQGALSNQKLLSGIEESIRYGQTLGADRWYHNNPLYQAFLKELGPEQGHNDFMRYMDYQSAASPRSKVPDNIRNASYYYTNEGKYDVPWSEAPKNPAPYGHLAQNLHRANADDILANEGNWGGYDVLKNPKPPSYATNLGGNLLPVAVDSHAFKNIGMRSEDPRFLVPSLFDLFKQDPFSEASLEKVNPDFMRRLDFAQRFGTPGPMKGKEFRVMYNPRELVESGKLSMEEALKHPALWAAKPTNIEYGAAERLYQNLANDLNMAPADAQSAAWAGAGKLTGLGTPPDKTFGQMHNERVLLTAKMRGEDPQDTLRKLIRREAPLFAEGGEVEHYDEGGHFPRTRRLYDAVADVVSQISPSGYLRSLQKDRARHEVERAEEGLSPLEYAGKQAGAFGRLLADNLLPAHMADRAVAGIRSLGGTPYVHAYHDERGRTNMAANELDPYLRPAIAALGLTPWMAGRKMAGYAGAGLAGAGTLSDAPSLYSGAQRAAEESLPVQAGHLLGAGLGGLYKDTREYLGYAHGGEVGNVGNVGDPGTLGSDVVPFFDYQTPTEGESAMNAMASNNVQGYADGGPVNINYPNGGQVPGYRFGGEFDQWYGEPGVSMYAGGGQVGQPDVIEYASNYNHGMVPDSYEDGAPRFNVNGALRALGDLVYAGEPGQKNIGNYYISRSDPQVATGEMPQEGYVKTYPQQRSFRPMPDEIDPRYHSRDKSMARSDMLYNFDHGGPVEMKEGGFLHDVLGTLGGLAGNLIPIPIVGPAIGKFLGHTAGNLVEGNSGEIGDDAGRDFTMGMYDADNGGFRPERILSAIGGLRGRDPGAPVISDSIQNFMARGGSVDDDALLYHAIDTQNFSRGGALRYCGGGYAR